MNSPPEPPSRRARLIGRVGQAWRILAPGRRAWRGAAIGLAIAGILLALVVAVGAFAGHGALIMAGGFLVFVLVAAAGGVFLNVLLNLLVRLPFFFRVALLAVTGLIAAAFTGLNPAGSGALIAVYVLTASCLGAALWIITHGGPHTLTRTHRVLFGGGLALGLLGLGAVVFWVLGTGTADPDPVAGRGAADAPTALAALPDPAQPGAYTVQTLIYGSGSDRHRPEYGAEVDIPTEPVNGRAFVSGWTRLRTGFWGFDAGELPLNGRVWHPEGEGPFPLVLIVHGNHTMADFSDPGYAYLGELFASHGLIAVSVDQNFLNSSNYADVLDWRRLEVENDARAWLLLEHLRQWRAWNEDMDSPFFGRVDLQRVGLVGHSRGGEAVAIAAAFNRLPRYPDKATIPFDYHFGIRAIAAIAPVDGQYDPAGQPTTLTDINYLALHGSYDGDVTTFQGSDQYARVQFSGADQDLFKSTVYIAGANHGQFNTTWGRFDLRPPQGYVLNRAPLLDPAEQERIAQVFLTAFLRTTLQEEADYTALFAEVSGPAQWLPGVALRTQYQDAATGLLATYQEDVDVSTTTWPEGQITSARLTYWQEYRLRSKNGLRENSVVTVGWGAGSPATYSIRLPEGVSGLAGSDRLVLAVGDARDPAGATEPLDFTIRLTDAAGEMADLPMSHQALVPLPLSAQLTRFTWMSDKDDSEVVLQTLAFPLADFAAANPAFDPAGLVEITFLFDRSPAGRVVLDDIGFRPE